MVGPGRPVASLRDNRGRRARRDSDNRRAGLWSNSLIFSFSSTGGGPAQFGVGFDVIAAFFRSQDRMTRLNQLVGDIDAQFRGEHGRRLPRAEAPDHILAALQELPLFAALRVSFDHALIATVDK